MKPSKVQSVYNSAPFATLTNKKFSKETLQESMASEHASGAEIASHQQFSYLIEYLGKLHCKSFIVENPYMDGDYLDDYASYYAKCFGDFGRWCKRVHFFDTDISEEQFKSLLKGADKGAAAHFQQHYLGFMVVRPLPEAVIGRTVLRTYDSNGGSRFFPVTKSYCANICGIPFSVKSLAFQEQDTVLAACATVALWSCFHKTSELFGTTIPTPASITRSASETLHYGRPIPSSGLELEEVCTAIRRLGLEPELIDLRSGGYVPLRSLIYAYLSMQLPVLLVIDIKEAGLHAVTLNGYSIESEVSLKVKTPLPFPPLKGEKIVKLFGHDDQIGPFSRIELTNPRRAKAPYPIELKTSWKSSVFPYAVVVPVYNKIRLRFIDVMRWLTPIDRVFSEVIPESSVREWDVHLILSNDYKNEVRSDPNRLPHSKERLLATSHPRFWWRAVLRIETSDAIELLFDATGIARSLPISQAVWLSGAFAAEIQQALSEPENYVDILDALGSKKLLSLLLETAKFDFPLSRNDRSKSVLA